MTYSNQTTYKRGNVRNSVCGQEENLYLSHIMLSYPLLTFHIHQSTGRELSMPQMI